MGNPDEGGSERAGRQREERRRAILDAATGVFAKRGYHSATITEVIEAAGIARGTFYLYFPGKFEVFDSVFAEALERLRTRIRPIRLDPGAEAPDTQLRSMLRSVLEQVEEHPDFARLLLSHGLHPDPEVARRVESFWDEVRDLIAASLERGVDLGLVRPMSHPRLCASALLGAALGQIRHLLAGPPSASPALDEVVDELILLALRGVGAEAP